MAALSAVKTTALGVLLTPVAASAGGDTVPVGSIVLVKNGGGASINVTVAVPGNTSYGSANPDIGPVAVAAGAEKAFGPFRQDLADTDGAVHLSYSGVTSVTLQVIK